MERNKKKLERCIHYLLIDIGFPMTTDCLDNIINAMLDTCLLVCSILDESYDKVLSIAIIHREFQNLLKVARIQGSFKQISKAMSEAKNLSKINAKPEDETEYNDFIIIAINSIIKDLKEQKNELKNWDEFYYIDICLFTQKNPIEIKKFISSIENGKLYPQLKKTNVVQIMKDSVVHDDTKDCLIIENSINKIYCFLREWLMTKSYDREQLQLEIQNEILFCDLKQRMISPSLVACDHKFHIGREPRAWHSFQKQKHIDFYVESEVQIIKVVNRIDSAGICESQVFGEPYEIVPTSYRKYGYEVNFDLNLQKFYGLCTCLLSRDEVLIAKMGNEPPFSFFVLIPSRDSILIKSIVSKELVIPEFLDSTIREISDPAMRQISESLNSITLRTEYNPLDNNSELHTFFQKYLSTKNSQLRGEPSSSNEGSDWVKTPHPALEKNKKKKRRIIDPLPLIIQYNIKK